jgi:hypothetical protein
MKKIINLADVDISSVKIYEDDKVMFLGDFDTEHDRGELYIYDGASTTKIASDVVQYINNDEKIYFINDESELCEKSLGSNKSDKLMPDVENLLNIQGGIVFINKDGEIYSKIDDNLPLKIGEYVINKELLNVINNKEIIYLTKNNELYINSNIIAQDVVNYVYNSNIVAYITENNEIHSYNLQESLDVMEIENAKEYSYIYLENELLFYNSLEVDDLVGFWELTPEVGNGNYIMKFSENKKINYYAYMCNEIYTYEIDYSWDKVMGVTTEDGWSFEINKKDDNSIEIISDDLVDCGKRISQLDAYEFIGKLYNDIKEDNREYGFSKSEAISYVINKYGEAEERHIYRIPDEMKNDGQNYYEVDYDYIGASIPTTYLEFKVYQNGEVIKIE